MSTLSAIDTTSSIFSRSRYIKEAGYDAVIRYLSPNSALHPQKRCTKGEISDAHVSGIGVGFVWETFGDHAEYFTPEQGMQDANEVLAVVRDLDIPATVPIFFAVDYDAEPSHVESYFANVHQINSDNDRLIGAYGSWNAIKHLSELGLIHYGWLAQSTGWGGYADGKDKADILQGLEPQRLGTLPIDPNEVRTIATIWMP